MKPFVAWAISLIESLSPSDKLVCETESKAEVTARYQDIAEAIDLVVHDKTVDTIYDGPQADYKEAATLVSIANWESGGFQKSADDGRRRGDNGKSWCLTQQNIGNWHTNDWNETQRRSWLSTDSKTDKVAKGWYGPELIKSHFKCMMAARRVMWESFRMCKDNPLLEKLNAYTSGKCTTGKFASQERMNTTLFLLKKFPVTLEEVK